MRIIAPAAGVRGIVTLPGDKSISHRYGMLSALAEGTSTLRNYSGGADCQSTLSVVEALGIAVERSPGLAVVHGKGLDGFQPPAQDLDCGNSGSTIRMVSGLLAGQPFGATLFGDQSLSKRPMARIMTPLRQMGASIEARDDKFPPLRIQGAKLQAIDYTSPVASAQVKSCVLFAGLFADGRTSVTEPARTRDHSEVALRHMGAELDVRGLTVSIEGRPHLQPVEMTIPGDLSSAAFFLVATLLLPDSQLVIENVGLNPTRAALIDFLIGMGARIEILDIRQEAGELAGNLRVSSSRITGGTLSGAMTAALIDEIPVLSVLGAASEQGLIVRDAAELRVKESDRIATICEGLRRMGCQVEEHPDGFTVPGGQQFHAARIATHHDHRIAMAFAIAALRADGPVEIADAEVASVSFPQFYSLLDEITGRAGAQ